MDSDTPAIEVSNLTRSFTTHIKQPGLRGALRGLFHRQYQTKIAVNDISFSIKRGEFVGFLGPNGAGKTTTLKILAGVLHPSSGTAQVLGYVPWKRESPLQKRFSLVLGQKNQLWWDLPAYDSFVLNRDIYDIPQAQFAPKVEELTTLLDLRKLLHVPVRKLSLGERMKCEVAASLLHSPEVLFLDEPTIGLDVVSQVRIREFLRDYNERTGITVLLTSHYMADIEALCKRVLIINEGRAIFDGQLKELANSIAQRRRIRLTLKNTPGVGSALALQEIGEDIEIDGLRVGLSVERDQVPQKVSQLLQQFEVDDLTVEDVEIESVIRDLFTQDSHAQK
ncbi:MAG TPA: ABC transporter ATP-binding protein [Abditibacteriaceae bacterium]|jgi:ABC-2 type transport system ATP-binding protein